MFRQTAAMLASRGKPDEVDSVFKAVAAKTAASDEWWRAASLEGLAAGARGKRGRNAVSAAHRRLALRLFESPSVPLRKASLQFLRTVGLPAADTMRPALQRSAAAASDSAKPADIRVDSIDLLALAAAPEWVELFRKLVQPREPEQVQLAAVRALGNVPGKETGVFLLANWKGMTAPVRGAAGQAIFRDPARVDLLINALEKYEIEPWSLDFNTKRQFLMHKDQAIRDRLQPLFLEPPQEREKIFQEYKKALSLAGDPKHGEQIFEDICVKCHSMNGVGAKVGPECGTGRPRCCSRTF